MRPPTLGTLFALAACLTLAVPAGAVEIHRQGHIIDPELRVLGKDRFVKPVVTVVHVAPPDPDDDGLANGPDKCPHEAGPKSLHGCQPEPITTSPTGSIASAPALPSLAPAGGGAGCTGMEAESGSAGYGAMSSSGYIGCYQISPDHFDGGSCSGLSTDPAGQDACAAIICDTEGAGAWTNDAGQNPCGRL